MLFSPVMTGTHSSLYFLFKAKTKGCQSRVDIGVKYADKQERLFDEEKMKAGQCVIGLQVELIRSLLASATGIFI